MKKHTILLPIEVSSRELHSKILLAYKFADEGCKVYLGDKQSIIDFTKYVPGAIYFDKGYHKGVSEDIYKKLEHYNINIISLDEENAVDFKDFQQLNLRFPDEILSKFKYIFLWGRRQYEFLAKNRKNFDENSIFVTGHPRFDLLKNDFRRIHQHTINDIKIRFKKFILVNTNFGLGNNIKGKDFIINNYGSRFPQIKSLINYQQEQVKIFIKLCYDIARLEDFQIVLRPHPEENIETYKSAFLNYDNIHAVSEGSVLPWIMASDLMIHHDCTTSIECAMLGKNSIAYVKDLDENLTTDVPLKISYKYDNVDDIEEYISSLSTMELKINHDILDDYFNFHSSSLNEIVSKIINIQSYDEEQKNYIKYKYLTRLKFQLKKIINRVDPLHEKKIEGLNYKNIGDIINEYDEIFNINNKKISVTKIHKRLYQVK